MKALVTGAAGFIGSNLAEALVGRGDRVVGLDNLSTGRRDNLKIFEGQAKFEFIEGDVRDEAAVSRAVRGVDVIFHQAAIPSVPRSIENPEETFDVSARGTLNILQAARAAGVRKIVFASSSSIYGNADIQPVSEQVPPCPISPYGASKLAAEALGLSFASSYGIAFVSLRYFNVFGPRQDPKSEYAAVVPRFISCLCDGKKPTVYGDGRQTRDFTYVGNVVHANLIAADRPDAPSGVYNIAAGKPHTVRELLETLCSILGKPFDPNFSPPRSGDILHSGADIRKAQSRLAYCVKTDFRKGLELTCQAAGVGLAV